MDYIKSIYDSLTTITDTTRTILVEKCKEYGFDINRGKAPFHESITNLIDAKEVVSDAIAKRKLIQLPITIQIELNELITNIIKQIEGLIAGTDHVVNLVNSIEELNISIWKYGFHNLSEEVLGYASKLNMLKNQETKLSQLLYTSDEILKRKEDVDKLTDDINTASNEVSAVRDSLKSMENESATLLKTTTLTSQQIDALLLSEQNNDKVISQIVADCTLSEADIKAIQKRFVEHVNNITDNETRLSELQTKANDLLRLKETETNDIIAKFNQYKDSMQAEVSNLMKQINGLLPGATSAGLAYAFEQRKNKYKDQLTFWTVVRFVSIAAFIAYGWAIFWDFHNVIVDYSKASLQDMTKVWGSYLFNKSPIIVALILLEEFSRRTFNKLFKLEEDYTHKQVLSQSFEGYKNQFQEIGSQASGNDLLNSLCSKTIDAISENPIRLLETEKEKGPRGLFGSLFGSKKTDPS